MRFGRKSIATCLAAVVLAALLPAAPASGEAPRTVTPEDAMSVKTCRDVSICSCGEWIAYTVSAQREAEDEPGGAYSELYLVSSRTGLVRPFVTGKVNVSSPRFSPDGSKIAFITARGEDSRRQVWVIPLGGGEATQVTSAKTDVSFFRWHPSGNRIAFRCLDEEDETASKLSEKGYGFIYYEENLRDNSVWMAGVDDSGPAGEPERLTEGVNVVSFEFAPGGERMALSITPENLIDQVYMFQRLFVMDLHGGSPAQVSSNPGKLGNYAFSPDGTRIAYCAALERRDHAVSQLFVQKVDGGTAKNLTEPGFRGHVTRVGWKDDDTVVYLAAEGVWNTLNTVKASGGGREVIIDGAAHGVVFDFPSYTGDFRHFAMTGGAPDIPSDVFYWKRGAGSLERLTEVDPWIADRSLGRQEVIRYEARDGLGIEGILVYPVGYEEGVRYPLIVGVHGGPESHHSNEWIGSYFNPAQVLAGRGYFAFYPNYRASTGYGTQFALGGYMDAAGREFDDIADGIDYLVDKGLVDRDRVGMGGGSYGGYASAWFATYYTDYVRAACVFVGITDLISKRGTTDIPYEELYVHSGRKLDADRGQWEFSLERSPVYYATGSKTAVLIVGGADDTRVHPSQSIELYRRLKMNGHPAVRLVQYPGEGHGNRRQPGRIDLLHRHLQWYDWYVKDARPLTGPMPPLLIPDSYGIDLGE